MGRIWRKPGVLMIAYLVLFALAVDPVGFVFVAAFLAWRVTRGGSIARGLLIAYPVVAIPVLLNTPGMHSASPVSFGLLANYLAQLSLLVSTPVYDRTRKHQAGLALDGSPLWVRPPRWMPVAAAAAGVTFTLLFLGNMSFQTVPGCQVPGYLTPRSAPAGQCATLAEGYPIHYLSASPSLSLYSGNKVTAANLSLIADPVITKSAAAEDLTIWTLLSFSAFYLLWLPSRRAEQSVVVREPVAA